MMEIYLVVEPTLNKFGKSTILRDEQANQQFN